MEMGHIAPGGENLPEQHRPMGHKPPLIDKEALAAKKKRADEFADQLHAAGMNYLNLILDCEDKELLHDVAKEILVRGIIKKFDQYLAADIDDAIRAQLRNLGEYMKMA